VNAWFSRAGLGWRIALLAWGIALITWLPFEDTDTRMVMVFSLAGCLLAALRFLSRYQATEIRADVPLPMWRRLGLHLMAGALAGLAAGPAAVLLMAVKSGLHAHPTPDFSGGQVVAALIGAPVWILAGILSGLGVWLFERARKPE